MTEPSADSTENRPPEGAEAELEVGCRDIVAVWWHYRLWLLLAAVVVLLLAALYGRREWQGGQPETHMVVRLDFDGADRGAYPNGLVFSPADMLAPPVLDRVHQELALADHCTVAELADMLSVQKRNQRIRELKARYGEQLAAGGLSPEERRSLEAEYEHRREVMLKSPEYRLVLIDNDGRLPVDLRSQVLTATLEQWQRFAKDDRGACRYQVPNVSSDDLQFQLRGRRGIQAVEMLRVAIKRLLGVVERLMALPDAGQITFGPESSQNLSTLQNELEELLRYDIQALLSALDFASEEEQVRALLFVNTRLNALELDKLAASERLRLLQEALNAYSNSTSIEPAKVSGVPIAPSPTVSAPHGLEELQSGTTVIPQISDSFLDKLITLAKESRSASYQLELENRIVQENHRLTAFEREERTYQNLKQRILAPTKAGDDDAEAPATPYVTLDQLQQRVRDRADLVRVAHQAISRQKLRPDRPFYTVITPPQTATGRTISRLELALRLVGVAMIAGGLALAACLLDAIRRHVKHGRTCATIAD